VDGEHLAPLLVAHPGGRLERGRHRFARGELGELLFGARVDPVGMGAAGDAGVVDPDVERAELCLDRRQRGVDLGAVADVGGDRQALAGELRGQRRGALVEVDHRDPRPVGGEPHAGRLADPGAAPGDRRDLALQARHQKFDFSQLVRWPLTSSGFSICTQWPASAISCCSICGR
jgi:hypothetical protein